MVIRNVREDDGRALLEMLDHLRQGAKSSTEITVRVLAAADHDGVCSAKMLARVLDSAGVKFLVTPVRVNTEIIDELKTLELDSEVKSVVLLNCGASLDLQQHLVEHQVSEDVRCFVIDAHRPLLLANLSQRNQRVIVLDDDPTAEARGERPPVEEFDADSDASDVEAESDGEKENEWNPDGSAANAGETDAERRERKRLKEEARQEKQIQRRRRLNEYYITSYFAMPTAMSIFKMARQTAAPSQDFLWLAAVCLMGYHDQGLLSEVQYNRLAWEELKDALDSSSDFTLGSSPGSTSRTAGDPTPDSASQANREAASDDEETREREPKRRHVSIPSRRRLRFESELRLSLYKHWSLEESMMHSAYFYGTLELHRDKGLRSLKNFFATAGLPPNEYKQLFRHMEVPLRKSIRAKYREHGKAYGLTESRMFLQQFVQDLGAMGESTFIQPEISCSDVVHVMTALLTSIPSALSSARPELLPTTSDGRRDTAAINKLEKEAMTNNFYQAYDVVLCEDPAQLRDGLVHAIEFAKAVQSLARQIRDTKAMHTTRQFRWCKIEQPPLLFRNTLAIRRLAIWLLQTLFAFTPKGEGAERPLLVIVRDQIRDTYICVGATPAKYSDQDEFGHIFRTILRADKSFKYRYDFFNKSCIEVAAEDFNRFLELMNESF
ncbi:unnamed protein product [Polarella glacialis]|uniref:Cell division control protein 45 n=1 Tax=Polarella glacialis TaxID=89957 RepID=A0A813D3Z8_POLGL|nr:unnamed protein product [Polarella glacialis]CAE8680669.1 unnamed protein product [Polarella glacialis]